MGRRIRMPVLLDNRTGIGVPLPMPPTNQPRSLWWQTLYLPLFEVTLLLRLDMDVESIDRVIPRTESTCHACSFLFSSSVFRSVVANPRLPTLRSSAAASLLSSKIHQSKPS